MHTVTLILYIIAAICFALAAFGIVASRVNFVALGLFAWVLVPLLATIT
jgi:hypothetical protein